MSYLAAIAALRTTAAGVSGIRKAIMGQPSTAQNLPLAFVESNNGERGQPKGQLTRNVDFIDLSVLVAFQDNTSSEDAIAVYIDSIPNAIDENPTLGGTVNSAWVRSWIAGYFDIGEVKTRRVIFTVEILRKESYLGGM